MKTWKLHKNMSSSNQSRLYVCDMKKIFTNPDWVRAWNPAPAKLAKFQNEFRLARLRQGMIEIGLVSEDQQVEKWHSREKRDSELNIHSSSSFSSSFLPLCFVSFFLIIPSCETICSSFRNYIINKTLMSASHHAKPEFEQGSTKGASSTCTSSFSNFNRTHVDYRPSPSL